MIAVKARRAGVGVKLRVPPDMIHQLNRFASESVEPRQTLEDMGAFIERCTDYKESREQVAWVIASDIRGAH